MKESDKVERLIRWQFIGPAIHVTATGRVLRKGEKIHAYPSEIEPFKDKFKPLEELPSKEEAETGDEGLEPAGTLVPKHHGGGRYSVYVKETGKYITDNYVTKDEAYQLADIPLPEKRRA